MNAQPTPGIIYAVANDKIGAEVMSRELIEVTGAKLNTLTSVMQYGALHADYHVVDAEFEKEERGNGTGYYDPVSAAIFIDADGHPVPNNHSIYIHDTKTNRRLYVVVLAPGNNLVIHDRYSMDTRTVFVSTSKISANDLIGMSPSWTEGYLYDLIGMARFLGFEFDRESNTVYAPRWKKDNWFKATNYSRLNFSLMGVPFRSEKQEKEDLLEIQKWGMEASTNIPPLSA